LLFLVLTVCNGRTKNRDAQRKVIGVMSGAQAKKKPSEEGLKISARGA
jgi:hypothetical protein